MTDEENRLQTEPGSIFSWYVSKYDGQLYYYWRCRHCDATNHNGHNLCRGKNGNCNFDIRLGFLDSRGYIKDTSYQRFETSKRDCADYKKLSGHEPP